MLNSIDDVVFMFVFASVYADYRKHGHDTKMSMSVALKEANDAVNELKSLLDAYNKDKQQNENKK